MIQFLSNSLKEEINNVASCFDKEQDSRVNWEYLKYKIFRFSKDYANKKAEQRKKKHLYLSLSYKLRESISQKAQICLRPFSQNMKEPKQNLKIFMTTLQMVQF